MSRKLSVIIPCYNAAATLGAQLASIAAQVYDSPWEVLVADNGSSDDSRAIALSYATSIPGGLSVIDASAKRGAGHARNIGAAAATGTFLLFCDADDEMAPGYLQTMSDALDRNDFVTCRYDYERLNTSWLASARQSGQAGEAEGGAPLGGFCHPTLPYAGGGGLGIRKSLHDKVGGFDTALRAAAGQEDTDYCIRAQLGGSSLEYVPSALMYIRVKTTIASLFVQAKSWAESGAYIQRRYQAPGTEESAVGTTIVSLSKHLVWRLIHLRGRRDLAQLIWQAGWSVGWIEAMLRMRGHLPGAPDAPRR